MTGDTGDPGTPMTTPPTTTVAGPRTSTASSSAAPCWPPRRTSSAWAGSPSSWSSTLLVYWAAETYVHWIALRALVQRDLTAGERRRIVRDGWPLVAACGVPLLFLGLEALVGMETSVALDLTLAVNAVLLFIIGWQMGEEGRLGGAACSRPWSRASSGSPDRPQGVAPLEPPGYCEAEVSRIALSR